MKSWMLNITRIKNKLIERLLFSLLENYRNELSSFPSPQENVKLLTEKAATTCPTMQLFPSHSCNVLYESEAVEKKEGDDSIFLSAVHLKETQRTAHVGNWTWDIATGKFLWSEGTYQIFGLEPFTVEANHKTFLQIIHPNDRSYVAKSLKRAIEAGDAYDIFYRILLPGGLERILHGQGTVVFDKKGKPVNMQGTLQDVTEIKKAEEKLMQSARVFERSKEAIIITKPDGSIVDVNKACCDITGFSREEVINQNPRMMKSGIHDRNFYKTMWQSLIKNGEWQDEVWDRRKNGEIYPKWLSITSIKDHRGATTHYVGIFTDLTRVKQTEERILQLTNYDVLTGLPNKLLFRDRLSQLIENASLAKEPIAVLFIDLDNFRVINDSLGIQAGDELLVQVAKRLKSCVTEKDTVSHFNSDEFAIILTDVTMENIPFVAQWTIDTIAEPFHLNDQEVFTTISIGISLYPNDGSGVEELLGNAISAMNFSRKSGVRAYNFYSEDMNTEAVERVKLVADICHAVKREEFVLHYQPRVNAKTGEIVGMEALIRLEHPEEGLILPGRFIPIAEETGLIVAMTEWLFKEAFKQAKKWERAGFTGLKMGINLSTVHFKRPDLVDNLNLALQETGLSPENIDLELTESIIMQDVEGAVRTLHELKELGCMLAIDDFGTGYSSLSYLKRFPIDIIKIDQAFIRELTPDSYDAAIVKTIIVLARSLNMKVIAEGVETAEQLEFLRAEDCDEIQGFYFSKPLPVEEFTKLLEEGRTLPRSPSI